MAASSPPHIPGMGLYVNWVRVGDGGWREITFSLPFEPSLSHVHWRSPETPGNVERSVDSSSDTFPCNWVNSSPAKLKGKDKSEEWELEARWATHFTGLDGAWGKIPDTIGKTHLCEFVVRDEEIRELKVEAKQQWKGICSILDWLVYRFQLVFVQIINGGDICCRCCGGGGHFSNYSCFPVPWLGIFPLPFFDSFLPILFWICSIARHFLCCNRSRKPLWQTIVSAGV